MRVALSSSRLLTKTTTTPQVLFLFSIGITKGKWGTLLSALLAFRGDYERCVYLAFGWIVSAVC